MVDTKQYALEIGDIFENLLDNHDISIPDEDREGFLNEARIYGCTWGNLIDDIRNVLERMLEELKEDKGDS